MHCGFRLTTTCAHVPTPTSDPRFRFLVRFRRDAHIDQCLQVHVCWRCLTTSFGHCLQQSLERVTEKCPPSQILNWVSITSLCRQSLRIRLARGGTFRPLRHSSLGKSQYTLFDPVEVGLIKQRPTRDEILNGKTHDRNSNYFARYCFEKGIELCVIHIRSEFEGVIS